MAFLHKLHKCRRNAVAAVASVCFLVLVLVFSVFLAARHVHDVAGIFGASGIEASSLRQKEEQGSCQELQSLPDDGARCRYLVSHTPCAPQGYVDYLRLFYCGFGRAPWLGGAALALWLLVLFYLLGDTASEYFCASLEGLSTALRLPPAIAGVTLLSLGNGAPDVLSSVVAFAASGGGGEDAGDVGLSSVLGGALFVSTVVAGVVSIAAGNRGAVAIERRGFVRDVCFLLVALGYLLAVLLTGTVTVWAAASFLSLYAAYVLLVWTSHCCAAASDDDDKLEGSKPEPSDLAAPLLLDGDEPVPPPLPVSSKPTAAPPPRTFSRCVLDALQSPLYLPRRLTIPDIAARRWSKPYAVASALLSPLLLAAISSPSSPAVLLLGALAGTLLAAAAAHATATSAPPNSRCARLPWLAGGFLMSVLWSYMLARELVALLVTIGYVAGVGGSVLGATVLAWGNSLGDLVADVAMAMHGGPGGAQTAVSGCYAGPAFNTVVGLGLSLTLAAGARYPEPYAIPVDASVYEVVGFLAAGLVWAMVVLPMRGMRLDRVLGVGLLLIYLGFLCIRLGTLSFRSHLFLPLQSSLGRTLLY
ncbi:cation/calcium exchanger 1-like [Phragmites australis]|uniref:cation/calcium exchanger 1-like n=1 Tax=Phragmites australis TaxID=29695 RepID=UPI002D77DBF3|nr:cation/calcium exchanger 1-like [Phragmites australis]